MVRLSLRSLAVAAGASFVLALTGIFAGACGEDVGGPAGFPDAAREADAAPDVTADAAVTPRGARVLGLAVDVGNAAFAENVQTARDGGATATHVSFGWDEVERPVDAGPADPDAGEGGAPTQLFHPLLHVADLVLPDRRMQALLSVEALDVGGSRAPAELAARPLDDAELGARYDRLTDYVLRSTPDLQVAALFVASDVDLALGDAPARYAALATFVTRAAAHAHAVRPGLKVGFTVTARGAAQRRDLLAAAWAASDVVGVTALPLEASLRAGSPTAVAGELDGVLEAAPAGKPVVVREVGYPTAAECGGDEAAQARFVSAVFAAWDRHADRIPLLTFRELDDASPAAVAALAARRGRAEAPMLAFLGSLGLRTREGRGKPAHDTLVREARARGF